MTDVLDGASPLRVGDVVVAIDGEPARGIGALRAALGRGAVRFGLERAGERRELALEATEVPIPTIEGADVELGALEVETSEGRRRWRTLVTRPHAGDRSVGLLVLAGYRVASLERVAGDPLATLVERLAPHLVTVRVERGDAGDSEGPPAARLDLDTERRAYLQAIERLRETVSRVLLFGHSVGGMLAATLPADGRLVYGAGAERWNDCLERSARRQHALRGGPDTGFAESVLAARPEAFHAQLDALDLEAAWRSTEGPTRVLHGEHDWVIGDEAPRALAALAPGASLGIVAGADHAMTCHESRPASLARYGRGVFADALVDEVMEMVTGRSSGRPRSGPPRS